MGKREVRPVAIFDRDGTIIDVVRDEETGVVSVAFHPSQLRLLSGAVEGMKALQDAGYAIAIATNQPGPAKGQMTAAAVERTNAALVERLGTLGVRVERVDACMHHPEGGEGGDASLVGPCDCRKPKAGMLERILTALDGDRAASWMIGDGSGDLQAGRTAGVHTALVFPKNRCELCPLRDGPAGLSPDVHAPTLKDLAAAILLHAGIPRAK